MCTGKKKNSGSSSMATAWSQQTAAQRANIMYNAARSGAGSDPLRESMYGAANPTNNPSVEQLRIRAETADAIEGATKTASSTKVRPAGDGGKRKKTAAVA